MSAYTEQEELEKLKAFWKEYGTSIIVGLVVGAALLFGYRYWTQKQETERHAASAIYEQLLQQLRTDKTQAHASGEKLIGEYAATPYAGMAALLLARQAHEAGDKPLARRHLEWVVGNAKGDAARHAGRLRLARILLDAGDANAATVLADVKDIAGFETEYYELRGDLALARGDKDSARTAYGEAIKSLPQNSFYKSALVMKLDDLGLEKKQ